MSVNRFASIHNVTPAKAGAGLFFGQLAALRRREEGSQAPDQVRVDDLIFEGQLNA